MTAIVIDKWKNNKCIVAADRRLTDDSGRYYINPHAKVIKKHNCLFASAGDIAPFEVFLTLPCLKGFDLAKEKMQFLLYTVVPIFRKALKTSLLISEDETTINTFNTDIIICCKGRAYNISMNIQHPLEVTEIHLPACFGSGGIPALVTYELYLQERYMYCELNNITLTNVGWRKEKEFILNKAIQNAARYDNACDDRPDIEYE